MDNVRIGTSGWSYPSGPGTWNGIFYPTGRTARGRKLDELAYYAEHFDAVEVNSTFYRVPNRSVTASWARRTPAPFEFALKLFQRFSHPAMYQRSLRVGAMPETEASPVPTVTRADVDAFKLAIDPLAQSGKLGALLVQFPPSFRESREAADYLSWLLMTFREYPMAVELRHRSWSDRMEATLARLAEYDAAWAQIDEPKFRFSVRQDLRPNLRSLSYMRLHGRNAQQWWTHDHPDDRYNYLYSPQEIASFRDTVTNVRRLVQRMYVFLNNHFAAKAVANAATLRHEIGQLVPGTYSDEMVDRYPFLRSFVSDAEPRAPEVTPPTRLSAELFEGLLGEEEEVPAGGAESPGE